MVFLLPVARHVLQHPIHAMRVSQKPTGSTCAVTADASRDDNKLIGIGVYQPRHNRIILVGSSGLLLRTIQHPAAFSGISAVFDPKLRHCSVVCKMKTQRGSQLKRPTIIKSADKDGRGAAEIGQAGGGHTKHTIGLPIGAKHTSDINERAYVVNDNGAHSAGYRDF